MFTVLPEIANAILVTTAAVAAAAVTVVVMAVASEPFGGWRDAVRYPLVRISWIIVATFAAYIAVKVVLMNL